MLPFTAPTSTVCLPADADASRRHSNMLRVFGYLGCFASHATNAMVLRFGKVCAAALHDDVCVFSNVVSLARSNQ